MITNEEIYDAWEEVHELVEEQHDTSLLEEQFGDLPDDVSLCTVCGEVVDYCLGHGHREMIAIALNLDGLSPETEAYLRREADATL